MKYIRSICSVFVVVAVSLTALFVGSVKGSWHYAMSVSGDIEVPMNVSVFPWVGADQLPDDVLGEDHQGLIEAILNGTYTESNGKISGIGLNNPDSYINQEIAKRANGNFWFRSDILGSMDFWEKSDIEKFFDTETNGLSFLLHFPQGQADTYYLYTTSVELGESNPNVPIGEKIYPVYRTELKKGEDGVWDATETKTGYALSAYYQNPITGSWLVKYPSLDPDSWIEQELGASYTDAIYAYVGQTVTAYIDDSVTPKYYKITVSSNKTVTVNSENTEHIIRVYNSQMSLVNTNGGAQGTNSVRFNASRNNTYYIEVSGATSITFNIS